MAFVLTRRDVVTNELTMLVEMESNLISSI